MVCCLQINKKKKTTNNNKTQEFEVSTLSEKSYFFSFMLDYFIKFMRQTKHLQIKILGVL